MSLLSPQFRESPRASISAGLVLVLLLTAPAAVGHAQDDAAAEQLDGMTRRYAGLTGDRGPDDPAALAGEFILLASELAELDRDALTEASRIDYD